MGALIFSGKAIVSLRVPIMMKSARLLFWTVVLGFWAGRAPAIVLFSDNFNTNTSGSWTKNAVPAANASTQIAEFAFDYSPFGIPPAPGSTDTLGLRLRANVPPDTTR